ncbi:hypothetical protein VTN49DRAFT_1233 [Thermomyces lanuginosus]|uniref:uncharacterized protein n=1 Tax=Thermomyces lanuginosus TaxID=5541 RepID=UPI003742AC58
MPLLVAFLALATIATAMLAPNYPINAQLPPVARVSEPFEFTFSPSTFIGGGVGLTYTLVEAPPWLRIDSARRMLYGTPGIEDTGDAQFLLVAVDASGSSSMSVTLVVSKEPGPKSKESSILSELSKNGPTSSPATVHMYPENAFVLDLNASELFTNTDATTTYYATSGENSPLPSWIGFDPANFQFWGMTPSILPSEPQTFEFKIVASDVIGFSAATVSFDIAVGQHILTFTPPERTLYFNPGQPFSTPHFRDDLTIDNQTVSFEDLSVVKFDGPSWLSLDDQTVSLSGTAPENSDGENVKVSVLDHFRDKATLGIQLKLSQLFSKGVLDCNATIGKDFSYTFDRLLLNGDDVKLDVDLGNAPSWAKYNENSWTLYGHVPDDAKPQNYSIELVARRGSVGESRYLNLNVFESDVGGVENQSSSGRMTHGPKAGVIAVAVVVPAVLGALLTFLCILCVRRRRRKIEANQEVYHDKLSGSPDMQNSGLGQRDEGAAPAGQGTQQRLSSSTDCSLPRLELPSLWETESLTSKEQMTPRINDQAPRSTFDWGIITDENQPNQGTPKRRSTATQTSPCRRSERRSSRREPLRPIQPRSINRDSAVSFKSRRYSRQSSGISVASGLPVRLSGAGHGAGGFEPPGAALPRLPRTSWGDETDIETLAMMFPRPLSRQRRINRQVSRASSPSPELDSLDAFIQARARNRNSGNPLFASRLSSRRSTVCRSLERAHRSSSMANTARSISSYADERRQGHSASARSVPVYEDRQPNSTVATGPASPISKTQRTCRTADNRARMVKRHTDAIEEIPRLWSYHSVSRYAFPDSATESADSLDNNFTEYRESDGEKRPWYRQLADTDEIQSTEGSGQLSSKSSSFQGDLAFV